MERAATRSRFIDSARRFEWSARSALRIARAPSTIEPDTLRKVARDLFAAARRERRRARR